MLSEKTVGNGDCGGSHDGIKQAISAPGKRDVVHPNISGPKQGDTIAVRNRPIAIMCRRAPNHGVPGRLAIMDVNAVNDDVTDVLDRNARAVGYMDIVASAVDGLVTVHEELLLEDDGHVGGEDDPQWLCLNDSVSKSAGFGGDGIVVGGVGDNVEISVSPSDSIPAEANGAIGELLPVGFPVGIAAPAIVDRVSSGA